MTTLSTATFTTRSTSVRKGNLYMTGTHKVPVSEELRKQTRKDIRSYLNRTRPVLRLMGGSIDYPLLVAGTNYTYKRYYSIQASDDLLGLYKRTLRFKQIFSEGEIVESALNAIESSDFSQDAMRLVFQSNYWGDPKREALFNRVITTLQPFLILRRMEQGQK